MQPSLRTLAPATVPLSERLDVEPPDPRSWIDRWLDAELVAWLREQARVEGSTVSALIAEAVGRERRLRAMREVLESLGGPVTEQERAETMRELTGARVLGI